jgi:ubiquinone/menaquinone biosynthesis C-methylase UbiE
MPLQKVNMTYEPFALEAEYLSANRAFISHMPLKEPNMLLDLACGIGTMTDLILEKIKKVTFIGIDISEESLKIAKKHFFQLGQFGTPDSVILSLIKGSADCLPIGDHCFDGVVMGNSIHLLPNKELLLKEIKRVLIPGGFFAFNSSFYAGTMPKGTEKFHHEWMKQAITYITNKDLELKKQGKIGIPRKRGTVPNAFSYHWPTSAEWQDLLCDYGFKVLSVKERPVFMTQSNFETIGAYGGFAKIMLSGFPIEEASEALQATVSSTLATVNMEIVPRLWLEIISALKQ